MDTREKDKLDEDSNEGAAWPWEYPQLAGVPIRPGIPLNMVIASEARLFGKRGGCSRVPPSSDYVQSELHENFISDTNSLPSGGSSSKKSSNGGQIMTCLHRFGAVTLCHNDAHR